MNVNGINTNNVGKLCSNKILTGSRAEQLFLGLPIIIFWCFFWFLCFDFRGTDNVTYNVKEEIMIGFQFKSNNRFKSRDILVPNSFRIK